MICHYLNLDFSLSSIVAVCINQEDNEERGQQVTIMIEIFCNAAQVITYIGPAFPGSTDVIKILDDLQKVWGR